MVFGVKLPSSLPTWMSKHYGVERDKVSQLLEGGVCKLCLSKKGKKEPCASLRWIDGRRVLFVPDIVRVMDDGSCKNVFQAYLVTHFAGKVEDVASYVLLKFKKKEHRKNFNEIALKYPPEVRTSPYILVPQSIGKGGYAPQGVVLLKYLYTEKNVQKIRRTWVNFLKAVEALHATGYIHTDLKPWNVVVFPNEEGRVCLIDIEDIKKVKGVAKKYRYSHQTLKCLSLANRAAIFNSCPEITTICSDVCEDQYNNGVINGRNHIFSKSLEDEKTVAALCLGIMYFSNRKVGVRFAKIVTKLLGKEFKGPQKYATYDLFSQMVDKTIIDQFAKLGKEPYLRKLEEGVNLPLFQTCIAELEGLIGGVTRKRQRIKVPEELPAVLGAEEDLVGDLEGFGGEGTPTPDQTCAATKP